MSDSQTQRVIFYHREVTEFAGQRFLPFDLPVGYRAVSASMWQAEDGDYSKASLHGHVMGTGKGSTSLPTQDKVVFFWETFDDSVEVNFQIVAVRSDEPDLYVPFYG